MDPHQTDIVALAWSRELGLPDSALAVPGARVVRVEEAAGQVRFLRLGEASALVGPAWALDRAAGLDDDSLGRPAALLDLTKDRGGSCSGPRILSYAGEIGTDIGAEEPVISHDLEHVLALQSLCPPDDVAEADLTGRRHWFTLVDDTAAARAGAAYDEWQGIVARMGVLTAPGQRRQGHGAVVGRLATNDAIDEGLIPQWLSYSQNIASRRLAARLGYEEFGSITVATVRAT
ncbi:GNAT family N-acetyltransferase [Rhodococcus sp. NPDC059234]|uniref:GNAT family N-acetyltransferase n=1 Tax=Rhodococcus sp. NPDC059234 TaxID=3346781 RepID=UPI003670EE26